MTDLRIRAADDPPSLLTVLFDADVLSWQQANPPDVPATVAAIRGAIEEMLLFLNTFLLLHEENRVCVLLYARSGSHVAYPLPSEPDCDDFFAATSSPTRDRESTQGELRAGVTHALRECLEAQVSKPRGRACASSSFATALCIINRRRVLKLGGTKRMARVLAMVAGKDVPEKYVSVMNCIFSAQRMGVPVDACFVGEGGSTNFQQAAHLTGGVYLRVEAGESLLQTMMTVFLPDAHAREFLSLPEQDEVDFRASCFSTRQVIQEGYTCSVCLSTFDIAVGKRAFSCPTCMARFASNMGAARPPLARRPVRRPRPT